MNGKLKAALLLGAMYGLGIGSAVIWQTCRNHHLFSPHTTFAEHRIRRLTKQLNLSSAQEQDLRDIFLKANERATQINEEVSWDLAEIHHDSVYAIRGILTPEQNREFEKLHHRYHLRRGPIPEDEDVETSSTAAKSAS